MPDPSPVVLITGASSGIGEATARLLGRQDYRLVLVARRMERLEALATEVRRSGGEAVPFQADLASLEDIRRMVQLALDHFGRIDILLNNAGMGRLDWLENLDVARDIEPQLMVNLNALVYVTQAVLPHMISRRSGHIINMGSLAGWIGTPTYTIYAASKFGVRGFNEALRREVAVWGIHVSGIYPGGVTTEFSTHAGIDRQTGMTTPSFLRLDPQDVARSVLKVIRRPRRTVILPPVMKLAVWLNAASPGLLDWLITWRFVRPERLP